MAPIASHCTKLCRVESSIKSDAKRSASAGLRSAQPRFAAQFSAMANALISFNSFASEIASLYKLHRVKVVLTGSAQVENRGNIRVANARRRTGFAEKAKPRRPVIQLHGFLESGACFKSQAQILVEQYDVIVLDQRSHGESEKVPFGLKVARLSKDLFELVTALNLKRVSLLGHSMGAAVIWSYIELFGDAYLMPRSSSNIPPNRHTCCRNDQR
jgi:predicted alpha/beta-fold hydrolase